MERGYLTGNRGRWWGGAKLGWLSGPRKARHVVVQGESLVESLAAAFAHLRSAAPLAGWSRSATQQGEPLTVQHHRRQSCCVNPCDRAVNPDRASCLRG